MLLAPGLDVLSRSFLRSMGEEAVTQAFSSELGGRKSLTCSEFVYRCFTEFSSPYAIEVVNPLCRWKRPKRLRSGGQDTDLGADLFALELNPAFSAVLDIEEPAARVLRGDPSLSSAVQGASVRLIKNLCRYNLQKDHTKPPESGVVASFVTPVDLWSSPSFSARTVLVRSPGEVKPALAHHSPGVGP